MHLTSLKVQLLRFTATFDVTSHIAVNKQWRYMGGWL